MTVTVTNTGDRVGAEVVQLYLSPPEGALARPVRELKGFAKVSLEPGGSQTVSLPLDRRSFAVWSDGWRVQRGTYTVEVGGLTASLEIEGEDIPAPSWQAGSWQETFEGVPSRALLEAMCGRTFPQRQLKKGAFTMDDSALEMREHSLVMRILCAVILSAIKKGLPDGQDSSSPELRLMLACSIGSPLGSIAQTSGTDPKIFHALLEMANGHYLRGLRTLISG